MSLSFAATIMASITLMLQRLLGFVYDVIYHTCDIMYMFTIFTKHACIFCGLYI